MQTRQYGTESIVAVSFRSLSPDYIAGTWSAVLIGASEKRYEGGDFGFRLFLNLHDNLSTFIMRSCHVQLPRYDRHLGDSSSLSANFLCRILCPCKSSDDSAIRVGSSN